MNLEHKVPPPVVFLVCGGLAWVAATLVATPLDVRGPANLALAIILTAAGFGTAAAAIISFRRAGTTVDPHNPDKANSLVTSGVFGLSRNPMYLSLSTVLFGWVAYLGAAAGLIAIVMFLVYITRYQILPEERALTGKFGDAYMAYCGQVRRWI